MDAQPSVPDGAKYLDDLRAAGFKEDEVQQEMSHQSDDMQTAGFKSQEIKDYWGIKDPDLNAVQKQAQQNVEASTTPTEGAPKPKREPVDVSPKPVEAKDVWDAMAAAYGNSILQLAKTGQESPIQMPENQTYAQHFANFGAGMVADAPFMFAGGLMAGPVGGFGLPAGIRATLVDNIRNGSFNDPADFARRLVSIGWDTGKGAITGAAVELAGAQVGAMNTAAASPVMKALTGTAGQYGAEVTAQTVVSNALEGQLPRPREFLDAAIAVGGLHMMGVAGEKPPLVADKLMNMYEKTGARPDQVLDAASNDMPLKQELLSENSDLPKEASPKETPPAEPAVDQPAASEAPPSDPVRDRILSRIAPKSEPDLTLVQKLKAPIEKVQDALDEAYANKLDYTAVIKDTIAGLEHKPVDENNAHILMRLLPAITPKLREAFEIGTRDKLVDGKLTGESFFNIDKDIKKLDGGKDTYNAYGIAANSLELSGRGIEQHGSDPQSRVDDKAFVDAHPEVRPLLDRVNKFRNVFLDQLAESGRYSKEFIDTLKQKESYFPMKKAIEPDPITGESYSTAKDLKKIDTSDLKLQDPYLQNLKDVKSMIQMAHENLVKKAYADSLLENNTEDNPLIRKSDNQAGRAGKNQIDVYREGERTLYDVDPEDAASLKAISGNQPALEKWVALLKPIAKAERVFTVDNPFFAPPHTYRQQMTAATLSKTGLTPFHSLYYLPKYIFNSLKRTEKYQDFVTDGGAQQSVLPIEDWFTKKVYEAEAKYPFLNKAWNTIKTIGEVSHMAITLHDNSIRAAEYERSLAQGKSRTSSAFAAREVLPDFEKAGLQQSAWFALTPFLKVHLTGQARAGQEVKENGMSYLKKSLLTFTVPALLLDQAQKNDDAVGDEAEWLKTHFFTWHPSDWQNAPLPLYESVKSAYPSNTRVLPDGTKQTNNAPIMRLQLPFTTGMIFGSMIPAAIRAFENKNHQELKDAAKSSGQSLFGNFIPAPLVPPLEQSLNVNLFTNQPILRQNMLNKVPELRYDRNTSETAKLISKALGHVPLLNDTTLTSPAMVENWIHDFGSGTYFVENALDAALRKAGVAPDDTHAAKDWAQTAGPRGFLYRVPNEHAQSINDFEDRYQKGSQAYSSIRSLMAIGKTAEAKEIANKYSQQLVDRLQPMYQQVQKLQSNIVKLDALPGIDPVQKRQMMDIMTYRMIGIAKTGNHLMDQAEQQAQNRAKGN